MKFQQTFFGIKNEACVRIDSETKDDFIFLAQKTNGQLLRWAKREILCRFTHLQGKRLFIRCVSLYFLQGDTKEETARRGSIWVVWD